jgi:hypothetical protein
MILVILSPEDIKVLLELVEQEKFEDEEYKLELKNKLSKGLK